MKCLCEFQRAQPALPYSIATGLLLLGCRGSWNNYTWRTIYQMLPLYLLFWSNTFNGSLLPVDLSPGYSRHNLIPLALAAYLVLLPASPSCSESINSRLARCPVHKGYIMKGLTLNKCKQNLHSQYKAAGIHQNRIQQSLGVY